MNSQSKKMELLGSTSIPKALLATGIPTMIGMLVNAFYNLVDAYFVGGLGKSQMGAISVVYPLGQVVVGLGLLFGNGAASYISRLLGRGDKENADKAASTALYSSVSVGAVIIIISMAFLHPILKLLGATDSILPFAATYASIYIVSCIFNVFNVTMNNIVTSEGAAKTTMCALLTGAVLNIALDPLFIYVFDLGVAGAAIATAKSNPLGFPEKTCGKQPNHAYHNPRRDQYKIHGLLELVKQKSIYHLSNRLGAQRNSGCISHDLPNQLIRCTLLDHGYRKNRKNADCSLHTTKGSNNHNISDYYTEWKKKYNPCRNDTDADCRKYIR